MQKTIELTEEHEEILSVFAARTDRTVEELISNYLDGWIGSLKPEAMKGIRTQAEEKLFSLSVSDERKIELLQLMGEKEAEIASGDEKEAA